MCTAGEGTLGVNVEFFLHTFTSALLLWSGDHKVLFSVIADICCKFRAELCASKADRTEYGVGKTPDETTFYFCIVLN